MARVAQITKDLPAIFNIKTPHGTTIINAKCSCNHLQSSHGNRFAPHHGACTVASCPCKQFTWVEHVEINRAKRS